MTDRRRGALVATLRVAALAAMTASAGAVLSGQSAIDLPALVGKTRAEVAGVFPGTTFRLKQWRGWKEVALIPGRDGRLAAVRLEPQAPISEAEAEDTVRRFGVTVDESKYFAGGVEHGYSEMTGRIKTVIYDLDADGRVRFIRIHAARADAEP